MEKLLKVIQDSGFASIDNERLSNDLKELQTISDSLPKDNVFSVENCIKLERLCIHGMNICDYWTPIIHIVMSEKETERDVVKNKAYINAENGGAKLTAELRKAIAESNDEYNNLKTIVEKIKGIKLFFEKKRETFKSAIFVFKDQLASYRISDKGNSGDSIDLMNDKTTGEVNW